MFKKNKYTRIYYSIIKKAISRNIDSYVEKHHIIPRSLGGNNSASNIVKLTAKEHFICHRLLTKMTDGENQRKMIYAINGMLRKGKNQNRYVPTARTYSRLKNEFSQVNPFSTPEFKEKFKNAHLGKKRSEETKKRMSEAWTDERRKNNPLKGRKIGPSLMKGKKNPNLTGEKNGFFGKTHSEEFKQKLSDERKGQKPPWYGKKILCQHCNREFDTGNYSRYHGDKCRYRVSLKDQ